jgi:hypothetical protein
MEFRLTKTQQEQVDKEVGGYPTLQNPAKKLGLLNEYVLEYIKWRNSHA